MKNVLLLATTTGYQIRSFGEAAARVGVRLVFVSDRCDQIDDPWWDQAIAVRFHHDRAVIDAAIAACRGLDVDGLVAVGDQTTLLAAHLSQALRLPGNPPAAASGSRNKLSTRRACRDAWLLTPTFDAVPIDADPSIVGAGRRYPLVIKPLALSGSRGVMRVDAEADFVPAFMRLRHLLQAIDVRSERDGAHDHVLIESFIPGQEFAIEGVLTRGVLQVLAIFDKPDPLDGPFFEETIYVTPSRANEATQRAIVGAIDRGARALGLRHGPIHAECRVNEEGVYVLEIAPRPIGGLCSRAVRLHAPDGTSVTLEEVLLRHAIGEDVTGFTRRHGASGVMMIPIPRAGVLRRASGIEAACAIVGIDDVQVTAKPETTLVPLPEGRSYLGFIFASGDDPGAVERSLRDAHGCLTFTIDRAITLATQPQAYT